MKTDNSSKGNVKYGARIIAVFLIAGGLLGILSLVMMHFHLAQQHLILPVISSVVSLALFALQVPVFHVARLTYEFSTGFSFRVMIGNTNRYIGGDIGSSLNFAVSPQSLGFMFGINLVAVI